MLQNMAKIEGDTRPLSDYTIPVNELLEYSPRNMDIAYMAAQV